MKLQKRITALVMAGALLASFMPTTTFAVTKPTVTKNLTIRMGQTKAIKVTGSDIKTTTFKSNKESVAKVTCHGNVRAKKAGTAKVTVTVKYGNPQITKKYICKIVVKKNKKLASEKKALVKLIKSKKAGSRISTNLDSSQYTWDKKGHLIGINWRDMNVKGKLSFASLPNLKSIIVGWDKITKLDISKNKKIRILSCRNTKVKKLNLDKNVNLEVLWYTAKNFVDLSKLSKLKWLHVQAGEAKKIDLSKNKNLEHIDLNNTQIENLVIEGFPKLAYVGVTNNKKMKSIAIRNNSELTEFNIYSNPKVTSIDLSGLTKMKKIGHGNIGKVGYLSTENNVTSIDVSGDVCLEELTCNNVNKLTEIKMEGLTKLKRLDCRENGLKKLDLSDLHSLETLDCAYNKLDSLDARACKALKSIICDDNNISLLDVSQNTKLQELDCSENRLTSLDLSKNVALKKLKCSLNQLTSLDLTNLSSLQDVDVDPNVTVIGCRDEIINNK